MRKILLGFILLFFGVTNIFAQGAATSELSLPFYPQNNLTQYYTYVVKDDGTSQAWVRLDGIALEKEGGLVNFNLPDNAKTEISTWYRDYGCYSLRGTECTSWGGDQWISAKHTIDGKKVSVTIPPRKVVGNINDSSVSVGISFITEDLTSKSIWGRKINIETGTVPEFTTFLNIGVYVPDGVYVRDYQEGPEGWGMAVSSMMSRDAGMGSEKASLPIGSTMMFDYLGGGEIIRYRNNVMPGEKYEFTFLSSTSKWKLYSKELSWGVLWLLAIAVVISLLLRMLFGRRKFTWYLGVTILILVLFTLIGGLWLAYRFSFGSGMGGGYPISKPIMYERAVPPDVVELPVPTDSVEMEPQ